MFAFGNWPTALQAAAHSWSEEILRTYKIKPRPFGDIDGRFSMQVREFGDAAVPPSLIHNFVKKSHNGCRHPQGFPLHIHDQPSLSRIHRPLRVRLKPLRPGDLLNDGETSNSSHRSTWSDNYRMM